MAGEVLFAAEKLFNTIREVKERWSQRKQNVPLAKELQEFIQGMETNMKVLKEKSDRRCSNSSKLALDSLLQDLRRADVVAQDILQKGFIHSIWVAKTTLSKMQELRERVMYSFQSRILFITLDVAIEGNKEMEDFRTAMERVNEEFKDMYSTNNSSMKEDIRKELKSALQPIVAGMGEYNADKIKAIRSMEVQTSEAGKFFADVVAELEKISIDSNHEQSVECFEDPITCMLMCDPVKGVDGHTYDRWTIVRRAAAGVSRSPFSPDLPFAIAVDDIDVRSRLFTKHPEQQETFRAQRAAYRGEALEEANNGNFGDAVSMLEHVLQWDPSDKECQKRRNEALLQMEVVESILKAGESLKAGDWLRKGNYQLIMQEDDNLVVYCEQDESGAITAKYCTWSSQTQNKARGNGQCRLTMRRDGNLVLSDEASERKIVWESNTAGSAGDGDQHALHLTETGTLEIRSSRYGARLWCNEPMSSLRVGESLKAGRFLVKGAYRLSMQRDDNLVLYGMEDGADERVIWASGTVGLAGGTGTCSLVMQSNGNLEIFDGAGGAALWMSNSAVRSQFQYSLHLRSDGCLDIRRPDGNLRWRHHVHHS